jgi:hypothetical protein
LVGHESGGRNSPAAALDRGIWHGAPSVCASRLRATWLADLLTEPIPLAMILRAAGLQSARTISELMPHIDPWLQDKGLASDTFGDLFGGAA